MEKNDGKLLRVLLDFIKLVSIDENCSILISGASMIEAYHITERKDNE